MNSHVKDHSLTHSLTHTHSLVTSHLQDWTVSLSPVLESHPIAATNRTAGQCRCSTRCLPKAFQCEFDKVMRVVN